MRDPARIPVILERLRVAWEKAPDLRLGQLIMNADMWHESSLFYIEDEYLLEAVERVVGEKR
jgi:hypothetical protein